MEIARFLCEQKDWTPSLENLLVSSNQSFKKNISVIHLKARMIELTHIKNRELSGHFWRDASTLIEKKKLKLAHNYVSHLKRDTQKEDIIIISKCRSSLTKILDSPLSLISPSTKKFTLNFPFLHYSLPTAAFLPLRYTSIVYSQ